MISNNNNRNNNRNNSNNNNNNYNKSKKDNNSKKTDFISYKLEDLLVDEKSINDYLCIICDECIFDINKIEALQCREGHLACRNCWNKSLSIKKECMTCRIPVVSIDNLSKNILAQNDFRSKKINCPNVFKMHNNNKERDEKFGCKQIITIDNLESHLKTCQFEFIDCPFNIVVNGISSNKCFFKTRRNQINYHREICVNTIGVCKHCSTDFHTKDNLKSHISNDCIKFPIKCTQQCNTTNTIERGKMDEHIQSKCPKTLIDCKYKLGGCDVKTMRCDQITHLKEIDHSFEIQTIMDLNQLNFNSIIGKLQQDMELIKRDNQELKIMVSSLNEQLKSTKRDNTDLNLYVSSLTSKMATKSELQTVISNADTNQQRLNQVITVVNSLPRKESIGSSYVKIEDHNQLIDQIRSIKLGQDNTKYKNTVSSIKTCYNSVIPITFGGMRFEIELSPKYFALDGNITIKFKKYPSSSIFSSSTTVFFDFKLSTCTGVNFIRFTKQQIFDSNTTTTEMREPLKSVNILNIESYKLEIFIEVLSNNEIKPIKANIF